MNYLIIGVGAAGLAAAAIYAFMSLAQRFAQQGKLDSALETYRQAMTLVPRESGLGWNGWRAEFPVVAPVMVWAKVVLPGWSTGRAGGGLAGSGSPVPCCWLLGRVAAQPAL